MSCIVGSIPITVSASRRNNMDYEIIVCYAAFLIVMSLWAFLAYKHDKIKAKKKKWRTKETVLLGLGFFGGAVGALAAMKIFRHKTRHWYFWVVNIIGLICHLTVLAMLLVQKFYAYY